MRLLLQAPGVGDHGPRGAGAFSGSERAISHLAFDRKWRAGGVSRLMGIILRAARAFGDELQSGGVDVLTGGTDYPWMIDVGRRLADAMPNGRHRVLENQEHVVPPEVLARGVPFLDEHRLFVPEVSRDHRPGVGQILREMNAAAVRSCQFSPVEPTRFRKATVSTMALSTRYTATTMTANATSTPMTIRGSSDCMLSVPPSLQFQAEEASLTHA